MQGPSGAIDLHDSAKRDISGIAIAHVPNGFVVESVDGELPSRPAVVGGVYSLGAGVEDIALDVSGLCCLETVDQASDEWIDDLGGVWIEDRGDRNKDNTRCTFGQKQVSTNMLGIPSTMQLVFFYLPLNATSKAPSTSKSATSTSSNMPGYLGSRIPCSL